jgi:uncharacterized membrane protein
MTTNEKPTKETLDNWNKDPNNWIWRIFYFNKEDKRLFPPKRNKLMGWTLNFANPISTIAIIALVVIISLVLQYLKSH